MIGFWVLVENHILNLDLWICSVLAGIFARPVFHTAIFHAIYHGEAFPIGLETIVRNFDQYFAVGIKLDSFNELSKFVEDSRFQHSTSDHIYEMITNNIPPMEKPERAVVDKDLIDIMKDDGYTNNQKSKTLKLYYLNKFGKKNFIRVFEIQDGDTIR
ncbi:MAG: hypothetical protein NTU95_05625 [Methanothrix sp.]|nr:hypothetical protein [Methanothrix sp.]